MSALPIYGQARSPAPLGSSGLDMDNQTSHNQPIPVSPVLMEVTDEALDGQVGRVELSTQALLVRASRGDK